MESDVVPAQIIDYNQHDIRRSHFIIQIGITTRTARNYSCAQWNEQEAIHADSAQHTQASTRARGIRLRGGDDVRVSGVRRQ